MSTHVTRPKLMPVSADPAIRSAARLAVRAKAILQTKTAVLRSKAMFGKDDLLDNLARDLDRARGRRDALASEATTLTAQIAEIEARLSEERKRRERDRILSEIEAIRTRIKQAAGAFAPVVDGLSKAIESAAAVVPEAREFNSFLVSAASEIDSVLDPLLRELDQRAEAVRGGHAALDLPVSAIEAPVEPPKENDDRLLRFPAWLSRDKDAGKKETAESQRSTAA
jgi:chromosome segregation ATPase